MKDAEPAVAAADLEAERAIVAALLGHPDLRVRCGGLLELCANPYEGIGKEQV